MAKYYTIVAIAGDNGETNAIGLFSNFAAARSQADIWQEAENAEMDPDGMHYTPTSVRTVQEWKNLT